VATAAPLVLIGAFMMGPIGGIDWDKLNVALPSFVTCTVVPFTYSIHTGIIAGILMDGILVFMTWCRNGCVAKKNRVDSGKDTPERQIPQTTGLEGSPRGRPAPTPLRRTSARGERCGFASNFMPAPSPQVGRSRSGTSTPTLLNERLFSPHAHTIVAPDASDKDDKVEKLLDQLRVMFASAGYRKEPRDEMLLQALEDYVYLRPEAEQFSLDVPG